ncbi:hypothetical protein IVB14_22955 [Bradyrhizobium sp. 180]|nr:hypothetical protein [Bradyrhizobium sp. 180]MCK1666031.1 hypothetical protein [Bradyrhizobium sp. 153]
MRSIDPGISRHEHYTCKYFAEADGLDHSTVIHSKDECAQGGRQDHLDQHG